MLCFNAAKYSINLIYLIQKLYTHLIIAVMICLLKYNRYCGKIKRKYMLLTLKYFLRWKLRNKIMFIYVSAPFGADFCFAYEREN